MICIINLKTYQITQRFRKLLYLDVPISNDNAWRCIQISQPKSHRQKTCNPKDLKSKETLMQLIPISHDHSGTTPSSIEVNDVYEAPQEKIALMAL